MQIKTKYSKEANGFYKCLIFLDNINIAVGYGASRHDAKIVAMEIYSDKLGGKCSTVKCLNCIQRYEVSDVSQSANRTYLDSQAANIAYLTVRRCVP